MDGFTEKLNGFMKLSLLGKNGIIGIVNVASLIMYQSILQQNFRLEY